MNPNNCANKTSVEWAYLAGLIDGDGCILIRRRDRTKTTGDRARGVSFIILVKIGGEQHHLGGLVESFGVGSLWVRKHPRLRHLAEWTIAGGHARTILSGVIPYLILKKRQAVAALNMPQPRSRWHATAEMRERQELARLEVRQLNRLGRGKKEVT